VPELTCLARQDIHLGAGPHVRCHGKGRKDRATPLTAQTVKVLRTWLAELGAAPGGRLFPTQPGGRLSRDAVERLVTKHAATAEAACPSDLAGKGLAPGRHYVDSGYLSAALAVSEAARHGIGLIRPLLADTSAQARAGNGYARADFAIDYGSQTVTCPQGKTPASWTPCTQRGQAAAVATFAATDCGPCSARSLCTSSGKKRRQLTVLPRGLAQAQAAARAAENTISFQADDARRAGVEGTMHQAASHGARRARYRGLPKTRLDHVYMACALNLLRLEAYWAGTPLNRRRTSHLARLEPSLAALTRN
jgi:hypothetical protein